MGKYDPGTAEFDAYAQDYDEAVNRSLGLLGGVKVDYFTRVKAGYIGDILQGHFSRASAVRLLDIGCGVGNFHPLLVPQVSALAGCDVSASCLETAAERNPDVDYRHYAGETLPFADGSFDCAIAICVLHHVPPAQWSAFAGEMKRVVRPGGLALVFEHNPFNPLTRRVVSNCPFDENAVLLRPSRTRALLSEAGFDAVETRAILSVPSCGPRTRALDGLFARLPLGAQYYARGTA